MKPEKRTWIGSIDGLRAIAALGVLFYHANSLDPHVRYPATSAWLMLGGRGVDLFFVISGFCLSFAFLRRRAEGDHTPFDLRTFAWARARRIIPPYYATLILFGVLALTPFGLPITQRPWHNAVAEFLQYFLFIFHNFRPPIDESIWTLGIEFRWYVFFPLLLALYMRSRFLFAILGLALYTCYYLTSILADIGTLPCFMLGIVAADMSVHGHTKSPWLLPLALAVLSAACAEQLHFLIIDHGDPLWHLAMFLLVLAGVGTADALFTWPALRFVGTASYSIYLVHMPVVAFFERRLGTPEELAILAGLSAGVAFWYAIEAPSLAYLARRSTARNAR
jgi:peptidoglycan/LPS O-acetylase OafA/YrhL